MSIKFTSRIAKVPEGNWVAYLTATAHCANGVLMCQFQHDTKRRREVLAWLDFMRANLVVVPRRGPAQRQHQVTEAH